MVGLRKNFILLISNKMIAMVIALLTASLINRALGPTDRGIFAEIQTWVALFVVFFGISMDSAIYHFANESRYSNGINTRYITILGTTLVYSLGAIIALCLFVNFLPHQLSERAHSYLLLIAILIVLTMLTGNLTVFLQAIGDIKASAIIGTIQSVVNGFIIVFAYKTHRINIGFVVATLVVLQFLVIGILIFYFYKKGHLLGGKFSMPLSFEILKVGVKQHLATIGTFVYTKVNQLIVIKYCGAQEAGIYAVAQNLAFSAIVIPATLQIVLYPRIIHATDDYEITTKSLKYGFYGWGIMLFIVFIFSQYCLQLYAGHGFSSSVNPFRILLIAAWLYPLSSFVAPYCVKVGVFYTCSITAILLGFISILLNLLLVPSFGSIGAASSTTLTCFLGFGIAMWLLWHVSGKNPLAFLNIKGNKNDKKRS
jgi:O-antigen/teichoic acid export membrane protein